MKEFELIATWAEDRNLIEGSDTGAQMLKLYEEFGELAGGMARQDELIIKDSIGDIVVVMTILAKQAGQTIRKGPNITIAGDERMTLCQIGEYIGDLATAVRTGAGTESMLIGFVMGGLQFLSKELNLDFEECVRFSYDEIKDRKGKMVDGVFIKEEDLI